MTKETYDKYFTTIIPQMYESVPKLLSKYKRQHLEVDVVVSEAYLYCLEYIADFDTEKKCKSYIFKFIDSNIRWYNSKMNRKENVNNVTEGYTVAEEIDDFEDNISNKVQLEEWYNNRKALLQQYRMQLTDKQKIIIYDCFFIKGFQTGKDLGLHLKINKDYALTYIREMKDDIIQFEIQEFVKNNIR